MLLAMVLSLTTPLTDAAHPRWFVGDWCFPEGHPLKLRQGEGYDGDESISYAADGSWSALGESGRWRIAGDQLIETRTRTETWALGRGEKQRRVTKTRITRHGRYAISMRGDREGWSVKCPG